jgi:hypothetical protein
MIEDVFLPLGGRLGGGALLAALLATLPACRRKHIPVASVPEIPYPTCNGAPIPATGELVASGSMRAGPTSLDPNVVERYEIRHRGCVYVASVRQEWPLGTADAEVVFDEQWLPLRAWRRTTIPGSRRADGSADIRRYELRTPEVTVKRRGPEGVSYEIIRGGHPRAVVGPGRGLITAWIHRAHLREGERSREVVLDFREVVERVQEVTLRREPDMFVDWLGRNARVYTIYGREPIFTDEHDNVIGDLSGMRPAALVTTPAPPAVPMYGTPDPVGTP